MSTSPMVWRQHTDDDGLEPKMLDANGRLWQRDKDGAWLRAGGDMVVDTERLIDLHGPLVRYFDRPREYARYIAGKWL